MSRRALTAAAAALVVASAAAPALATRPATQQEIDGIVAGVNAYTTPLGYADSQYLVNQIRVSSVATPGTGYAAAQVTPTAANRGRIPNPAVLLRGAGSSWTVIDAGTNFCDVAGQVPTAVIADLFNESCRPTPVSGTIAVASQGGLRVTLSIQRGPAGSGTVYLTLQRATAGRLQKVTERRLGPRNAWPYSQVAARGGGYVTLNAANSYTAAQVFRGAGNFYAIFPFQVTAGGLTPLRPSSAPPD